MFFLTFLQEYLSWHYSRALKEIGHVSRNFIWFTWHYFGTVNLWSSIFLPFKRITEQKGRPFNFEDLAGFIIINLISRMIGFLLRFTLIVAGYSALILLLLIILLTYLVWLTAPAFIMACLVLGISLITSSLY